MAQKHGRLSYRAHWSWQRTFAVRCFWRSWRWVRIKFFNTVANFSRNQLTIIKFRYWLFRSIARFYRLRGCLVGQRKLQERACEAVEFQEQVLQGGPWRVLPQAWRSHADASRLKANFWTTIVVDLELWWAQELCWLHGNCRADLKHGDHMCQRWRLSYCLVQSWPRRRHVRGSQAWQLEGARTNSTLGWLRGGRPS